MSPVGRRPAHSGVQSRRYCLSWRGDIPGENRQFRPVTGARQERSTWQTDVQNRRSTGPDANIDKPFTSLNSFTPELKKCILPTFQKAIVWVM